MTGCQVLHYDMQLSMNCGSWDSLNVSKNRVSGLALRDRCQVSLCDIEPARIDAELASKRKLA